MPVSIPITPETKIAALLEAYPALEDVLIAQAPVFKNLKNPVLRKTVAKVATIEKAARIGGVSPRELVRVLREAAGLPTDSAEAVASTDAGGCGCGHGHEHGHGATAPHADEPEPSWVTASTPRETIDADAILAAGETPLPGVMRHAAALQPGETFRIVSGFRPVPLTDALGKKGYKTHTRAVDGGRFETFVGA